MSFWTLIFALSMAFIVALVVTMLLKAQAGFQPPESHGLTAREAEAIRAENERLKQQVSELTERLIVLERIATDSAERVSSEIEKLR